MFTKTELLLMAFSVLVTGAITISSTGCGAEECAPDGTCDQGQTDAGTAGDNNPITGEDGGTPDGGDVIVTGDAGGDAGQADCSKLRAEFPATCEVNGSEDGCDIASTWIITVKNQGDTCLTDFGDPHVSACSAPPTEGTDLPLHWSIPDRGITGDVDVSDNQVVVTAYKNGNLHGKTICHF